MDHEAEIDALDAAVNRLLHGEDLAACLAACPEYSTTFRACVRLGSELYALAKTDAQVLSAAQRGNTLSDWQSRPNVDRAQAT